MTHPIDLELLQARAEIGRLSDELSILEADHRELKEELHRVRAERDRLRYRVKYPRNRPDPQPSALVITAARRVNAPNWQRLLAE